jgi:hypothetical protein
MPAHPRRWRSPPIRLWDPWRRRERENERKALGESLWAVALVPLGSASPTASNVTHIDTIHEIDTIDTIEFAPCPAAYWKMKMHARKMHKREKDVNLIVSFSNLPRTCLEMVVVIHLPTAPPLSPGMKAFGRERRKDFGDSAGTFGVSNAMPCRELSKPIPGRRARLGALVQPPWAPSRP